jgi:hypothetical protein
MRITSFNVLMLTTFVLISLIAPPSKAQQCQSLGNCRAANGEGGALLHQPNSNGAMVWTSPCGPNTSTARTDNICEQISTCEKAGAFGKFLRAVTFDCKLKHFNGYFGLDGVTFGILDFTAASLPTLMHAYNVRNAERYKELFDPLAIPTANGCVDANWICDANKQAKFMCDAKIRDAFQASVNDPDFEKSQVDVALNIYEERLKRYASLGLKTEFGNTAMAVVANNLKNNNNCRPAFWKQQCAHNKEEGNLVNCMLDQYVIYACRGSRKGSEERRAAIKKMFINQKLSAIIHPPVDDVIACTTRWGNP